MFVCHLAWMDIRLTPKQQGELESVIKAIAAIVIIPWVLIVCGMVSTLIVATYS